MDEAAKESGVGPTIEESEEEIKPNPYTHETFYLDDHESNILMDDSGNIKAATLPKLISKFTIGNASMYHTSP